MAACSAARLWRAHQSGNRDNSTGEGVPHLEVEAGGQRNETLGEAACGVRP